MNELLNFDNDLELLLDKLYNILICDKINFNDLNKVFYDFIDKYGLNNYINGFDCIGSHSINYGHYNWNKKIVYINSSNILDLCKNGEKDYFIYYYISIFLHELNHVIQRKIMTEDSSEESKLLYIDHKLLINTDFYKKYYEYTPCERDSNYVSSLLLMIYSIKKGLKDLYITSRSGLKVFVLGNYDVNNTEYIFDEYNESIDGSKFTIPNKLRFGLIVKNYFAKKEIERFNETIQVRKKTLKYLIGEKRV